MDSIISSDPDKSLEQCIQKDPEIVSGPELKKRPKLQKESSLKALEKLIGKEDATKAVEGLLR